MYNVDNAIIMAAGVSSRFAPLSYEMPKALTEVKGEILIERQIQQLHEAGIREIYIIVGYKAEQFGSLQNKMGVKLIKNTSYMERNNHSSIYAAKNVIRNENLRKAAEILRVLHISGADTHVPFDVFEIAADYEMK